MYRIHRAVHWASLDAYIRSLGPAGWWRMDRGVTVTGSGVSQVDDWSGNARHLKQGTDANRPVSLLHSGTNYLYLPGVSGNYASTPDSAANSITGDIEIIVYCNRAVGGTNQRVVSKSNVTNAYALVFTSGDTPSFVFAGGTVSGTVNTVGVGTFWIKCTRVASTGVVAFSKSADGVTWSSIGGGTGATGNLSDGTDALCIGIGADGSTQPFTGRIYRAIIKSGIDGTTVADFNPSLATDQASSFVASTGETWTINSTGSKPAQIVGRSSLLFDGTAHFLKCDAFTLNQPTTVLMVVKQVSWANVDALCDGDAIATGQILQFSSSARLAINAGAGGTALNATPTLGDYLAVCAILDAASSSLTVGTSTTTGNPGTANMGGFTLGSRGGGGSQYSNIQVAEVILLPIALDATQRARIVAGLMARHGVA